MSRAIASARGRWLKTAAITRLREDIAVLLDAQAGVMTVGELAEALLAGRGSLQGEPVRTRQALAVVRAAVETERDRAAPRWIIRRSDFGTILLARDALAADAGPAIDGERLADYAETLGRRADALAAEDPLRPSARVLEALQAIEPPAGIGAPAPNRLLQLAAAASRGAALSSRLELYPRGMPAARALKLGLNALTGARELTPRQVRERIAGRYPEALPVPGRPELDALLLEAGSELQWRPEAAAGKGAYVSPLREFTTVVSGTALTRMSTLLRRFEEVPTDRLEIEQFDQRLRYSVEHGRFLVLLVPPARLALAEHTLAARFPVQTHSLDALLIRHMKAFASEKRVDWRLVLRADAVPAAERPGSRDWGNLQRVVRSALPALQAELAASPRHLLVTNLGLLARYDQLALVDTLREATGRPGGPPGLWLLIPADAQQSKPVLDGKPIPVFTAAQWTRIPDLWLAASQPQALAS